MISRSHTQPSKFLSSTLSELVSCVGGGAETFRGALVMPLMNRGYRTGTIRFGLLTGCKAVPGLRLMEMLRSRVLTCFDFDVSGIFRLSLRQFHGINDQILKNDDDDILDFGGPPIQTKPLVLAQFLPILSKLRLRHRAGT